MTALQSVIPAITALTSPFGRSMVGLLRSFLPQVCALCAARCGDALLCGACAASIPRPTDPCSNCALPAPHGAICGRCLARPPPFDASVAAWSYGFPADRLIHALKYGGQLPLAVPMARALLHAVRAASARMPDAIVAMPLSGPRQRERGFNQAREIARPLARSLGVPLIDGLARIRDTVPQATLSWDARARNVKRAFSANPGVAGLRIAIVDDVMTTGATLGSAAKSARRAGALHVSGWIVARTPPSAADIAR